MLAPASIGTKGQKLQSHYEALFSVDTNAFKEYIERVGLYIEKVVHYFQRSMKKM